MDAKTFGAFLARVRREQGLTQAELAEQLNAEVVQSIGNRFVLFRRSRRDDVEHIRLVRE